MQKIIDAVIITILILSFLRGWQKGLMKSLSGTLSWMAGILFCRPIAKIIYNLFHISFNNMFHHAFSSIQFMESYAFNISIIKTIADNATSIFCTLIAFAIISLFIDILMGLFCSFEKITFLGYISRLGGGICTIICNIIIIWLLFAILEVMISFSPDGISKIISLLNQSMLLNAINKYNVFL